MNSTNSERFEKTSGHKSRCYCVKPFFSAGVGTVIPTLEYTRCNCLYYCHLLAILNHNHVNNTCYMTARIFGL